MGDRLRPNGVLVSTAENRPFDVNTLGLDPIGEDAFTNFINFIYIGSVLRLTMIFASADK